MRERADDRGVPPNPAPRRMDVAPAERALDIAVVCPRFPLPMTRADQMTVAHWLAFLAARGHRVDLYALHDRQGRRPTAAERRWVAERCRAVLAFEQPLWRRLAGLTLGLARGRPLQVGWFDNAKLRRALRRRSRTRRYDVAYCYTLRSAEAGRGLGGAVGATFLAMQVSQTLNTERIARCAPHWAERAMYRLEHRLVAAYEARIWRDFTRATLIGVADLRAVRAACAARRRPPMDNHLLAPHGVDADRFRPREEVPVDDRRVAFCGVMATNTNVGAALWFVENVWPTVRSRMPQATLAIIGRLPRREILALHGRDGISVTGEVADPADHVARAAVCVNPMRAGAGMQNKLLEFLAMAKPVVATTVANEGIGAKPNRDLAIADDAADFAAEVVALLGDAERRRRLGRAGRAFALRHWTWEAHFLKLEGHMARACEDAATRLER